MNNRTDDEMRERERERDGMDGWMGMGKERERERGIGAIDPIPPRLAENLVTLECAAD